MNAPGWADWVSFRPTKTSGLQQQKCCIRLQTLHHYLMWGLIHYQEHMKQLPPLTSNQQMNFTWLAASTWLHLSVLLSWLPPQHCPVLRDMGSVLPTLWPSSGPSCESEGKEAQNNQRQHQGRLAHSGREGQRGPSGAGLQMRTDTI